MDEPQPTGPLSRVAESLSVKEVAEFTGKHPQTVRRWISDGTLEGFRIGHRELRVTRASLRRWAGAAPQSGPAPVVSPPARSRPAGGLFDPEWGPFDHEPFSSAGG